MKIMHIIDGLGRGGAETLLLNSIKLLSADEHIVVCLSAQYEFEERLKKKFAYHVFPVKNKLRVPEAVLATRKLIKKHKPDIVHAHLLFAGLVAKMATPKNVPLFYSIHSNYGLNYFKRSRLISILEKLTARSYHHIIGVTNVVVDYYMQHIQNCGSRDVLYNFVDEAFFKTACTVNYKAGSPLRCMAVGNLRQEKNYEYILAQFTLLKNLPITLDIYGAGNQEEKLKKYKADNDLTNVAFKGRAGNVNELMCSYDVFICCSVSEGFGIAPLEAMAARLPVIASSIDVFKEVIADAAFFVETDNDKTAEPLSRLLEKIYTGILNLSANVDKAFYRAKAIASQQNYVLQLKQIYKKYRT
jgi:glycosyltransferase involved in cell wall biosynthesis